MPASPKSQLGDPEGWVFRKYVHVTLPPPQTFVEPQIEGMVQVPQFAVLMTSQSSSAVTEPQSLPSRLQNCASLSTLHARHLIEGQPDAVDGRHTCPP